MAFYRHNLALATREPVQIIDLTAAVDSFLKKISARDGLLLIASPHTTLGVVLNEACDHLEKDMKNFLKKLAPPDAKYHHNDVAVDGRPNAHSHLLALVIPSQATLAVFEGRLQKGSWQSLFAVELDGPRAERKIHLTFMGETS